MGLFEFIKSLGFAASSPKFISAETDRKIKSDWLRIGDLVASKSPSAYKQALLIADKDIDAALRDLSDGETLGERLKNARNLFDKDMYHKLWEIHKIRNNIVHEPDYDPPHYVVKEAIEHYKNILVYLRVNL